MKKRKKIKYVHEGQYVAEIEVTVREDASGWSPYLSVDDVFKLDNAREALRQKDLDSASQYGKIYELRPISNK